MKTRPPMWLGLKRKYKSLLGSSPTERNPKTLGLRREGLSGARVSASVGELLSNRNPLVGILRSKEKTVSIPGN